MGYFITNAMLLGGWIAMLVFDATTEGKLSWSDIALYAGFCITMGMTQIVDAISDLKEKKQ